MCKRRPGRIVRQPDLLPNPYGNTSLVRTACQAYPKYVSCAGNTIPLEGRHSRFGRVVWPGLLGSPSNQGGVGKKREGRPAWRDAATALNSRPTQAPPKILWGGGGRHWQEVVYE